jgi:hypothetical protein
MSSCTLRIANGAGFWGDNIDAPVRLVESSNIDVLTLEYLAELTLAILAHQRSKNPAAGYVSDFPELLARLKPHLINEPGLRIVTNAGGLNPVECARRCGEVLGSAVPIAFVTGDDVLAEVSSWLKSGVDLSHMESHGALKTVIDSLVCANVYLGASSIAEALQAGARVVITGRVADASLTLGPAMAHFGWQWNDWPRLAGATVAGHLIECGAQATGGLWHRWNEVANWDDIGYPIAELEEDGSFVITKPAGSGGFVTVPNLTEQLVYEIGDPACYRTPDIDVDLTSVLLEQAGADRVRVTGSNGSSPTDKYKLSAVYRDGWTASGMLGVVGRDAEAKARTCGRILLEKVKRAGYEFADSCVEVIGAGDLVRGVVPPQAAPFEVVLRVSVRDPVREGVARFCKEFAPLITSGPAGIAGYASGRPEPRPAFGYWPALVPKALVTSRLHFLR